MSRRNRSHNNVFRHPKTETFLVSALVVGALALAQSTHGNEHGASKNPGYDTQPYFRVGPMEEAPQQDRSLIPDALTAGRLVCNTILVSKLPDGSNTITVRPVRDQASPLPLVLTNIGAFGDTWSRPLEGTTYHRYALDGTPQSTSQLTSCREETVTVAAVSNAANTSNHTWVLAGPNSDVSNGSTIPVTLRSAIDNDLVAFNETGLSDDQVAGVIAELQTR